MELSDGGDPRERSARIAGSEVDTGGDVKLVPGGPVDLINLSETGALVEGRSRCAVGSVVTLCLGGESPRRMAARVVRCNVSVIHRDSTMSYQLGLEFDEAIALDDLVAPDLVTPAEAPIQAVTAEALAPALTPEVEELVNEW